MELEARRASSPGVDDEEDMEEEQCVKQNEKLKEEQELDKS